MPYEVHNATITAPGRLSVHSSIKAARKEVSSLIRHERSRYGNRVNKLHASRAVHTMQRGDYVKLTIGKRGYHIWNAFCIH